MIIYVETNFLFELGLVNSNSSNWLNPYSCELLTSYSAAAGRLKAQLA